MINTFLITLSAQTGSKDVLLSIFWLIGGVGFILCGVLFKTLSMRIQKNMQLIIIVNVVLAAAVIGLISSKNPWVLVFCFGLSTLTNPCMSILLSSKAFALAPADVRGRVIAFYSLLIELGALLGLCILKGLGSVWILQFVLFLLFLVVVRVLVFWRIFCSKLATKKNCGASYLDVESLF